MCESLSERRVLLLVGELPVLHSQLCEGLFHLCHFAGGGLADRIHLSEGTHIVERFLLDHLQRTTDLSALTNVSVQPLGRPFQFVVVFFRRNLQSKY